jgi:hypothetical protein
MAKALDVITSGIASVALESPSGTVQISTANSQKGPRVQFARFEEGQLTLFSAHTLELEYLAISHVWGTIEWRKVSGVQGDVLTSERKAAFIADELPALVGENAFWMDTLTVNQRDQAEVIATVQAIPDIFRDAARTIAVREGDGFYHCCVNAAGDADNWRDFKQRMMSHGCEQHWEHVRDESYLQRLWTLQECLLSHTIQFAVVGASTSRSSLSF